MHETHQFEVRMRRLGDDIENSKMKAEILEDELKKVTEEWEEEYERILTNLKEKLKELTSGTLVEKIEGIVESLKDKDKTLSDLEFGINELKGDVN
mmetsp:Transcript_40790/g.30035  ORF Transcript_40790/g.30035 Transcript_40790/m.30035 type:complete len:96 (-) Transcript_40790:255-542(-)|eukprot:CAMPEP_0202960290 /NCGR_PEP_ID=MMETSP1396-20130829/4439_1 /ASSEMBLY_ACC=CAM_ASM_000872 /TAXON_ID= /ORGANISM="Pseudokeronopsis sp., Strain Brazil" /LENGTH=95 /DNA_ID=CAMNT_0049679417 /DNA_START=523 /DNA_END=810 /DNA_ORIENTATION=-